MYDMIIIEVPVSKVLCDKGDMEHYINVLNGLVVDCARFNGYREGYRNEMILDMTVSAYMLGLDPQDILGYFMDHGLITNGMDDEQPSDRMEKMLLYKSRFYWDYMLDPDTYYTFGTTIDDDVPEEQQVPFKFQLVFV